MGLLSVALRQVISWLYPSTCSSRVCLEMPRLKKGLFPGQPQCLHTLLKATLAEETQLAGGWSSQGTVSSKEAAEKYSPCCGLLPGAFPAKKTAKSQRCSA